VSLSSTSLRCPRPCDDRPALLAGDRTWTHAALHAAADDAAEALRLPSRGLVLLFAANSPGAVLSWLAARRAGHAVALFGPHLSSERRAALVGRYQPEWVITTGPPPAGAADDPPDLVIADARATRRHDVAPPPHPDLDTLLSTSGTTGSPKLARLSHRAIVENAAAIAVALELCPDERAMLSLPLPYAYGLSVLTSHLLAGGSVRLAAHSPVQRAFWEDFDAHGCTSFSGVPASYQHLRRVGVQAMALPTLRNMTQAGGRLSPALVQHYGRWLDGRGGRFWVMYGQTEATARIAVLPADERDAHPDSAGRAIPGGQLSIETAAGAVAPTGTAGEVVFRAPSVMMGYARERADLVRGDELGGLLHTGDRGRLDADGRLYLEGRSDRLAKLHGKRIDLDDVEAIVAGWGPTAVVGGDDRLHLFCAWGNAGEHRALAQTLAAELSLHHLDLEFHRVEALPLSAHGKLDYRRLCAEIPT